MSAERWFTDAELRELSRPTMDRAIEAIDAGEVERARELCDSMRDEWRVLHDVMGELILGLISYVQERLGDDGVEEAWRSCMERGWRRDAEKAIGVDRRRMVEALAATWRAHSLSGRGPVPASFTITEDEAKITFTMHPCGSGQRMWQRGLYDGEAAYGKTQDAHDWSYGRKDFPLYCTHCTFMNEMLPIEWYGLPLYPSNPPEDFDHDPCVWHWYKDVADIPEEHWSRYGATRPQAPRVPVRGGDR
jgi:hypothetical protein